MFFFIILLIIFIAGGVVAFVQAKTKQGMFADGMKGGGLKSARDNPVVEMAPRARRSPSPHLNRERP